MAIVKVIEVIASSEKGWEDAARNGVKEASKTVKNIKSAWVSDQKMIIDDNQIKEYRVILKISFEIK
ncbi:dodecin domain-containing protein [Aquimarina sp. MMG015]|uniref:dodecin family protein n=1 Tax=Aquimarina TaxID=290174 RepID=UPI0003FDAE86|nr:MULTISPECIES: dodecin family protein [Aquimarina]AXT57845.1 dodecin domain-containing protein [Aquimarina sp. AD1]MBQ4803213.1 dodecin domain-containing protein [Aquimarina sp. MMG015]RKN34995.1 dodecin domain-containing protein [Aquimarina sp. AD1]